MPRGGSLQRSPCIPPDGRRRAPIGAALGAHGHGPTSMCTSRPGAPVSRAPRAPTSRAHVHSPTSMCTSLSVHQPPVHMCTDGHRLIAPCARNVYTFLDTFLCRHSVRVEPCTQMCTRFARPLGLWLRCPHPTPLGALPQPMPHPAAVRVGSR